ncbi:serine threonine- kinase pim-2-like protein [Labeo rohita]|uniref:non-specific serine/threonine protein kinase n=2 Tax=Labeo rohita TaxID=84645 RepID=A0A498NZ96_LABRO|nr:serine threonine- kinase pim-2-like protein [Labeo rohita]
MEVCLMGQSVHEPCVQPEKTPAMSENRHSNPPDEAPVGAVETNEERNEAGKEKKKKKKKKKRFWKWPSLHFPCLKTGTYDLDKAETKYGIETANSWSHSEGQSVNEPCVQPKGTPTKSENSNPNLPDEVPDGAVETDEGGNEAERGKKKKRRFWKWPSFHFPCLSSGTYDLDKAETTYGTEAENSWINSDAPEDHAAEEQLVQNILDKGHLRGQYKVGCKMGEGGCGTIYEGTRCNDGLKVALKCSMKMQDMPSLKVPGHPKHFPMEIGLMLKANEGPSIPQIIKLLDWVDDKDYYVMVIERPMPCMDLFSFVEFHGGKLDEGTARIIMRQAIDAAQTCCKRGVFHRDIKLENLLVKQDTMEVKLIDFGCGTLMTKFAFKDFQGTRVCCPPEFYMKGKYHAKPTTVWTLGFMLYEMLCGECPKPYDRHMISVNLWTRHGLSQECCQMICACLQPKPKNRLSLDKMHLHDWFKVTE